MKDGSLWSAPPAKRYPLGRFMTQRAGPGAVVMCLVLSFLAWKIGWDGTASGAAGAAGVYTAQWLGKYKYKEIKDDISA